MNINVFTQDNIGKISTLQGARFLFVLLIFLSHCSSPYITSPFDFGGECGVSFFFILSGFVLSFGYGPRVSRGEFRTRQFFWRHFMKLYPLHLLLFAIMLVLDWRIGNHYDWSQILTTLLLVQSWIPSNHTLYNINPVSWFLCDTIFFYLIFKYLSSFIIKMSWSKLIKLITGFVVVYLIAAWHVPNNMINCTLYANPLLRAFDFALGIVAYRYYKTADISNIKNCTHNIGMLVISIGVGMTLYGVYQMLDGNGVRSVALFWPVMPVFIICLATIDGTEDFLSRLLSSRLMMWLGNMSFEFFMVHSLVMRLLKHVMKTGVSIFSDYMFFGVALCASILAAWVLNRCFTKMMLRK